MHGGPGIYTLYRHLTAQQEVQLSLRRCNLRALCHCSVAIRIQDLVIGFDICSKGYLQVWSRGPSLSEGLPEGADLVSLDEGRGYRLTMPTGTAVTLGPYLSTIEVEASTLDEASVEGLCGQLGRQPRALSSPKDIFNEWRWVTNNRFPNYAHLETPQTCPRDFLVLWSLASTDQFLHRTACPSPWLSMHLNTSQCPAWPVRPGKPRVQGPPC